MSAPIYNTLYNIAESGKVSYTPTWSHTKPDCLVEYIVNRIDDGVERPLSAAEKLVLFHSKSNGWMDLLTSDYTLDGEIWKIKLLMKSIFSETSSNKAAHIFDIEFRDICWDSVLKPPVLAVPYYEYDLWEKQGISLSPMIDESKGLACGGYTHEIFYLAGPMFNASLAPINADLSPFTINELSTKIEIKGALQNFTWIGLHTFQIKATNGKKDSDPMARGK